MAVVKIYVDVQKRIFLAAPGIAGSASAPFMSYGDTPTLNIYLQDEIANSAVQSGYILQPLSTAGLSLVLYIFDGTQNGTVYTQQLTFTADPTNNFFIANLALNTAALLTLVQAGGVRGGNAYMMLAYFQNGLPTVVLDQPIVIGVGLPSGGVVVPAGQTPLSAETARATFVQINGPAGQGFYITSPNGKQFFIEAADQPDGTAKFTADPVN